MNRRTVLRAMVGGSAAAIGLPLLEHMLNGNGTALATGEPVPTRFGVWYWGGGTRLAGWIPYSTGNNWAPNTEMAGLADLVPYVSVVTGCEIKTATHPHHSGMTGIMTGQAYYQVGTTRDTIVSTFARQSVDQDAAEWLCTETPLRSFELGVTTFRGTDEGTTFQHLSHNGPNAPNPSEYDAVTAYRRLFSVGSGARIDFVRQSVLDTVSSQVTRLQGRLGYTDRQRLEQHLDGIRALEQRLGTELGACTDPGEPATYGDQNGQEQIAEKNLVMSQLTALALSCDFTRAFSIQFSTCGSEVVMWPVGATNGLHTQTHNEGSPQPVVDAAIRYTMDQLGTFLRTLRDTPDGAGNLLETCSILCTTDLTEGLSHSNQDYPILIAGLGNGRLRGGYHYRSGSLENTSKAVLAALWGAGVNVSGWGVDAGYANSPVGGVLA